MDFDHDQSRRAFLKRSAALGIAGVATPFVTNLAAIGEAAAATASDYKALVCIFLYGGNDYANTLTPYDQRQLCRYTRGALEHRACPRSLAATALIPTRLCRAAANMRWRRRMASLMPLFDAGKLAVALNVGTLVQPTTKAQYPANSVPLPPKLFSHNDQQSYCQASNPGGRDLGLGRADRRSVPVAAMAAATLTCINASGNAVYLTGKSAVQYAIGTGGPIAAAQQRDALSARRPRRARCAALMTGTHAASARQRACHASASARSIPMRRSAARWPARRQPASRCSRPATASPTSSRSSRG